MTGPIDWNALYGAGSPMFNSELQYFNSTRDQFLQSIAQTMAQRRGQQPGAFSGNTHPMAVQQGVAPAQGATPPQVDHSWHDEDLVGAAQFWGIPEQAARAMPRDQLIGIVNDLRSKARPDEDTFMQRLGASAGMLGSIPGMIAVGAGEAITGGLSRLPVIGEALGRMSLVHKADQTLRMMEEGLRASTPESFQWVNSGANIAGNLGAMFYPTTAAFAVAGKIGTAAQWAGILGETAGPMARIATQGVGAGILLAGRGVPEAYMKVMSGHTQDISHEDALNALEVVGGGAALPVAWHAAAPAVDALMTRVANSFGIGQVMTPTRYLDSPMARQMSGGVNSITPVTAEAEPDAIMQLRSLAQAGNEQARTMLSYMQGGVAEIPPNTPEGARQFFSGASFSDSPRTGDQRFAPPDAPLTGPISSGPVPSSLDPAAVNPGNPARGPFQQQPDFSPQFGNRPEPGQYSAPQFGQGRNPYLPNEGLRPEGADFGTTGTSGYSESSDIGANSSPDVMKRRFVYRDQGNVVGDAYFIRNSDGQWNSSVGVDPAYRRQGIATNLYKMASDAGIPVEDASNNSVHSTDGFAFQQGRRAKVGLNLSEAENSAAQLNKAATIIQSPAFPEIAKQSMIDEVAVAKAAISQNPGGSSLVQGITDPASFIQNLGGNARFAQRGTRLDALISEEPVTDAMVQQYEKYGVYSGQRAITSDGMGVTVRAVEQGRAWVDPIYSGSQRAVSVLDLHPWTTSPSVKEVPHLWDQFSTYADARVLNTAQAMGGAISPDQLAAVRSQNLMQYSEDFLTDVGIHNPADRARVRSYFNLRYVDSFKDLAPAETAMQQSATAHYGAVADANPLTPVGALDQAAATKGFYAVPVHEGQWIVAEQGDRASAVKVAFESADAAHEWIRTVAKELPDITPASDAPVELAAMHPNVPAQPLNTNESVPDQIVRSIGELAEAGDGGSNVPPAQVAAASGNIGRLKNLWTDGFLRWQPARRLFSNIDQALVEAGAPSGIAADYDNLSQKLTLHHNEMHPYMDELTDILRSEKTKNLTDGTWTRVYEMPAADAAGLAARNEAAVKAGINPATFDQFEGLMQKLFPQTSLDEIRQIPQYISHIAQRQSDPSLFGRAFEDFPLGQTTQPFYEYARTGNLNAREMDPRVLGETYIRAVHWQKNMAEPFNAVVSKWQNMAQDETLKPAAGVMENWLKIIRYGYHADDDFALDTMHGALRWALGPLRWALGLDVTRQQARELFNFGLNATHSGLLGFRLNVMARDIQQFWLAVPRAGTDLMKVMGRYATSAEERSKIWGDALDAGAVALQSPRMAAPGSFAGEMERLGVGEANGPQMTSTDPRMRAVAKVTAAVRDITPGILHDTKDSMLHPMYMYGKQSELMRALTYTAGRDKAATALAEFRAAGENGDISKLMGESGARTFDPSWQRQFQNLVASGEDANAASFLGRQLADATQFKYGSVESPWVGKSLTGRIALQFGNYSMQYYQYLRESLANGNMADKAKFLTTIGAVSAGLEAASRSTSWNFRLMNPFFGLNFTGGPWLGIATNVAAGVQSIGQSLMGSDPSPTKLNAMNDALGQGAGFLNPVAGLWQNAKAVGNAMESPYPMRSISRYEITGQINNTPDVSDALMPQAQAEFQQSLQQSNNPVSIGRMQAPNIPQQQPIYPQGVYPQANAAPVTPMPGGSAYGYRPNPAAAVGPDTSMIPFAPHQAGVATAYNYSDVVAALRGDPNILKIMSPEERRFLDSIRGVPIDAAVPMFRGFLQQKMSGRSGAPNGAGGPPTGAQF